MIKLTQKELKVLRAASEYRWNIPTPSQIAYIMGEKISSVNGCLFRARCKFKAKSNDELIKKFKDHVR